MRQVVVNASLADGIKVLVVDDVVVERQALRRLVENHPSLLWVGEAGSVAEAQDLIPQRQPDALFLDVHMPALDGFHLARNLAHPINIVFVSAWPHFAIDAFSVDAVDYLIKPVETRRFEAAVRKLERAASDRGAMRLQISDRICLKAISSTHVAPLSSIRALLADGDFTSVLMQDKPRLLVCRRLGSFDEELPAPPFARLDRSLIVNVARVSRMARRNRNQADLWLHGLAAPITIGRTAIERLREILPGTA